MCNYSMKETLLPSSQHSQGQKVNPHLFSKGEHQASSSSHSSSSYADAKQEDEGFAQQAMLGGLFDLLDQQGLTDFGTTNERLIKASKATLMVWALMTIAVYWFSPAESYERTTGLECQVCTVAFCLLLISNVSRFLPLIYTDSLFANHRRRNKGSGATPDPRWKQMKDSGFLVAAFTVQFTAMVACGLMAFFPTPILIDPITHTRVYLVRWCEWAPLGFLLTFLSEEIDVPTPANRRMSLTHAIVQGLVVCTGFVYPFISNPRIWWSIVAVAVTGFSMLFVRVYQKQQRLKILTQEELAKPLLRAGEVSEAYDRCRLSHRSLVECCVVWTFLVFLHFAAAFVPHYVDVRQYNVDPLTLPMIAETFCEVLSKHLHILVVESVFQSFSSSTRSRKVLDQLRRVMSVFWERASDALVLSLRSKTNNRICLASPTFLTFMGLENDHKSKALVFELSENDNIDSRGVIQRAYIINMEELKAGSLWGPDSVTVLPRDKWHFVESVSRLVLSDSTSQTAAEQEDFMNLSARHHEGTSSGARHEMHTFPHPNGKHIHCEAIATRMEYGSSLLVLRDISDRIRRFEAEKKLAIETTERQKDDQTNRFTRHEVKNGLLAGIYLCDTMKESLKAKAGGQGGESALTELESTLHEVLDTVLSEAMSRDVIHEAYVPREEAVDICNILGSTRSEAGRFPLQIVGATGPLPQFLLDKSLLRYIHRNALSNACKYGKRDGVVSTSVQYNQDSNLLAIEIVNEPGNHHERLVTMGEDASKGVFEPGRQLHKTWDGTNVREASVSSGDGAWITRKCARIMGGDCNITFNPERTIFKLAIPAKPVAQVDRGNGNHPTTFSIPKDTFGIVMDDSKVQRKLLGRLLSLIGIQPDRQVVLGATVEEVQGFHSQVKELMRAHPESRFFVIADENLDFTDGSNIAHHQTISGSLCVQRLLRSLESAQDERLLAVVRSANDSAEDLETYRRRSHGFMPKEPIRKENVMDLIRPLWEARFPSYVFSTMAGEVHKRTHVSDSSSSGHANNTSSPSGSNNTGSYAIASTSSTDLIQSVEVLDGLIKGLVANGDRDVTRWPQIKEKFLVLQGDMMTLTDHSTPRVSAVIDALKDLRVLEISPVDMRSRWQLIRSLIISLV